MAQNLNVPRSQEDYITQISEEMEGGVTKKMFQEFSRTDHRILGVLARLDDFLKSPLIQGHSGTAPETSRNVFSASQGTNEDDSQSNPDPEAGIFNNQMTQNSGPEGGPDMEKGVQKEILWGHDMVTGVHEEITYCSPSASSGKQKKNRFTSQPQFRSENTPTTIEADQILLALQQLANNNNSANFHNNINRISKLPKSLLTTMRTFDGKSEKFELFEDLFQTNLKLHNQLTEEDRIKYFHSLLRGDALQTFKNINDPTRENLRQILTVFRRKDVKPQSMATAKHKVQKIVFNAANQKLVEFPDELQKLAKYTFGIAAHAIIEQFINAELPPHLKKSKNQAHLGNGTYKQIVTHLEKKLQLNGMEGPDELQIKTLSHNSANTNSDRPKPMCHHCKKPRHYKNQCRLLKRQKNSLKRLKIILETKTAAPIPLSQKTIQTKITKTTETVTELKESQKLFIRPMRQV